MLGTCLSLEMARRGFKVDLYDREARCITQAGARNEGKIHLGFVYGADPSFRTADVMLKGALSFYPLLRRWIGNAVDEIIPSAPFLYLIEKESLLSPQDCEDYFFRLEKKILEYGSSDYPGGRLQKVEKLSSREWSQLLNHEKVAAVYRTPERSIDVQHVASILRAKLNETAMISFHSGRELTGVALEGDQVEIECEHKYTQRYDIVVNALWDGRLALDQQVGLFDEAPWSYRLKHAIFLKTSASLDVPPVTIVQGAYGDIVSFGQGRYYFSWYPICKQGFAKNLIKPPDWERNLPKQAAEELTVDAIINLAQFIPSLAKITLKNIEELRVLGGVIYAHGETDVIDPKSGLHNRYQPTIQSKGGYYSINPGKYTLCPSFADQVAHQICAASAPSLTAF